MYNLPTDRSGLPESLPLIAADSLPSELTTKLCANFILAKTVNECPRCITCQRESGATHKNTEARKNGPRKPKKSTSSGFPWVQNEFFCMVPGDSHMQDLSIVGTSVQLFHVHHSIQLRQPDTHTLLRTVVLAVAMLCLRIHVLALTVHSRAAYAVAQDQFRSGGTQTPSLRRKR